MINAIKLVSSLPNCSIVLEVITMGDGSFEIKYDTFIEGIKTVRVRDNKIVQTPL